MLEGEHKNNNKNQCMSVRIEVSAVYCMHSEILVYFISTFSGRERGEKLAPYKHSLFKMYLKRLQQVEAFSYTRWGDPGFFLFLPPPYKLIIAYSLRKK